MNKTTKLITVFSIVILAVSCKKTNNSTTKNNNDVPSTPGIITTNGIANWDALSSTEKNKIYSWNSLFMHQSVGGDLEDGSKQNGFNFEYYAHLDAITDKGIYSGLFNAGNGEPLAKMAEFKTEAIRNKNMLRLAVFKFGYNDIEPASLTQVQTAYKSMVADLKSNGIRVMHIAPPLVFDAAYNQAKMDMRQWMIDNFKSDIIFDLTDIESTDLSGNRAQTGAVWHLYSGYRSVPGCASYGQGTDQPSQGHLCHTAADRISKAFLYAIYLAGK